MAQNGVVWWLQNYQLQSLLYRDKISPQQHVGAAAPKYRMNERWSYDTKSSKIVKPNTRLSEMDEDGSSDASSFQSSHVERWNQRYSELEQFQKEA
jgi:hypothetical protein